MSASFVYRCYDASEALLYVGCTFDVERRLSEHALHSGWFPLVARKTSVRYETRREALDAEKQAIFTENPVHNERRPEPKPRATRKREQCADLGDLTKQPRPPHTAEFHEARISGRLSFRDLAQRCLEYGVSTNEASLSRFERSLAVPRPDVVPALTEILGIDMVPIYIAVQDEVKAARKRAVA